MLAVRLGEYLLVDQQLDADTTEDLQRWLNAEGSVEFEDVQARKRLLLAEISGD